MRKPLFIARQGRRPDGLLGQLVARIMATETRAENALALDLLDLQSDDRVLELGSGHGDTLARAAETVTAGALQGIDFSAVMHGLACRRHRRQVASGRLKFTIGATDRLPFEAASFDKALSVHTVYFWERPLDHLGEARRVLRLGGRLVLGFRPAGDPALERTFPAEVYRFRPLEEIRALAEAAGFRVEDAVDRPVRGKPMAFLIARAAP